MRVSFRERVRVRVRFKIRVRVRCNNSMGFIFTPSIGVNIAFHLYLRLGITIATGLNKYRPHDRTTTAQHEGTVSCGVRVPSYCAVAGQIPFAACS